MRQTTMLKPAEVKKAWYVIDAEGKTLGRLATQAAAIIRGKNKTTFTPNVDCGDNVIIINAAKVVYSGDQDEKKTYYLCSAACTPYGLRRKADGNRRHNQRI